MQTWTETMELGDPGEKKLRNATNESNEIGMLYGHRSDECALFIS